MTQIKLLILDVDGVLTDGKLYYSEQGQEIKSFSVVDGLGLVMLKKTGLQLAIISGRRTPILEKRAQDIAIDYIYQGIENKLDAFESLLTCSGLNAQQCAYIGDDLVDLPIMRRVAFAATVPHSPLIVRTHAHYITQAPGGAGAVREVCEKLMQAQGTYETLIMHYLR